jgi:hypothetical protein
LIETEAIQLLEVDASDLNEVGFGTGGHGQDMGAAGSDAASGTMMDDLTITDIIA